MVPARTFKQEYRNSEDSFGLRTLKWSEGRKVSTLNPEYSNCTALSSDSTLNPLFCERWHHSSHLFWLATSSTVCVCNHMSRLQWQLWGRWKYLTILSMLSIILYGINTKEYMHWRILFTLLYIIISFSTDYLRMVAWSRLTVATCQLFLPTLSSLSNSKS